MVARDPQDQGAGSDDVTAATSKRRPRAASATVETVDNYPAVAGSSPAASPASTAFDRHASSTEAGTETGGAVDGVKQKAGEVVDQAKQKAAPVLDQAQEKAGQVADQAQEKAQSKLAQGKDLAAAELGTVAQALRQTSEQLQQQDTRAIGEYTARAADKLNQFSSHLRESNVNQLLGELEDFARREPASFLASAFAVGVLGARFLKSSSQQHQNQQRQMAGGQTARGTATGEQAALAELPAGGAVDAPAAYAPPTTYAPEGLR